MKVIGVNKRINREKSELMKRAKGQDEFRRYGARTKRRARTGRDVRRRPKGSKGTRK